MADSCPWANGERHADRTARNISAELRIPRLGGIFKPIVLSKREVIEVPLGEHEAVLSPKFNLVRVDSKPHKSTGPAFTPGVVRSGDELAKRQWFLAIIRFHRLKYRLGERAAAMGCSPHA
jgi:hypothetical protein